MANCDPLYPSKDLLYKTKRQCQHIVDVATSNSASVTNPDGGRVDKTLSEWERLFSDELGRVTIVNSGDWSTVAGQPIEEADRFKGYAYPDGSDNIYAVRGSVTLPITRPSTPVGDDRFYLASAVSYQDINSPATLIEFMNAPRPLNIGDLLKVSGYHEKGIGGATWKKVSTGQVPNQSPADLQELSFTDSQGSKYELVRHPIFDMTIDQIGAQKYINGSGDFSVDIKQLIYTVYKVSLALGSSMLKCAFPQRSYYSSSGLLLPKWTMFFSSYGDVESTSMFVGTTKWTESEVPHSTFSGVTTWYSLQSFQLGIVQDSVDTFPDNIHFSGIDFITAQGFSTDIGLYVPYLTDYSAKRCNFTGNLTGVEWKDMYSGKFERLVFTARANNATGAGNWSMKCAPRVPTQGCGTTQIWELCGFTDYILGFDISKIGYSNFKSCYSEGTLTQAIGIARNCNITIQDWGCERLKSLQSDLPILRINGGEVVLSFSLDWSVDANANVLFQADSGAKVTALKLKFDGATNASPDNYIFTTDDSEVVIMNVTKPTDKSYNSNLGAKTFSFTKDLVIPGRFDSGRIIIGNNGLNQPAPIYMFNDDKAGRLSRPKLRIKGDVAPTSASDGEVINGSQVLAQVNFANISDPINTTDKYRLKMVLDDTSGKPLYAKGALPEDPWRDALGNVVYTPS